jgi:outer membrane biosynthesis protein TonB
MMEATNATEDRNRTTGLITSAIIHALLVLLFLLPMWSVKHDVQAPPIVLEWGGGGDDAALGDPDAGQNSDKLAEGNQLEDPTVSEPSPEPEPSPSKPTPPVTTPPAKSEPAKTSSTTEDPNVAAIKRAREQAAKDAQDKKLQEQDKVKKQQEQDRLIKEQKAKEEQARQEAERKKQAAKDKYGGKMGTGSGTGQGGGGKPGDGGINDGNPDGKNPYGTSGGTGGGTGGGSGTGTGPSVGGGLGGRKLKSSPKIYDNSQKTGIVVISVCVDGSGTVTEANFTLKNSTTQDSELVKKAKEAALKTRFEPSSSDTQCGTLAYNFKLQ